MLGLEYYFSKNEIQEIYNDLFKHSISFYDVIGLCGDAIGLQIENTRCLPSPPEIRECFFSVVESFKK